MGRVVLVLAAATSGGLSIGLLAVHGGSAVTSGVTLYQAVAYAGLTPSLILLPRAVIAVLRDDPLTREPI